MSYPAYKEEKVKFFRYCIYTIVITIGVSLLAAAAYEQYQSYYRYKYGVVTQGVVTDVYVSSSAEHEVTVYDVQFNTPDKGTYLINNHFLTLDHLYTKGQVVPVIYEPTHPEDGRIDNENEKSQVVGGMLLMGVLILLLLALFHYWSFFFSKEDKLEP